MWLLLLDIGYNNANTIIAIIHQENTSSTSAYFSLAKIPPKGSFKKIKHSKIK
jgi:hypothetical protein